MKKILFLLLFPVAAFSQNSAVITGSGGSSSTVKNPIVGSIYKQNSSSGGTGWNSTTLASDFGAFTSGVSTSAGSIVTTTDGAGFFTDSICLRDTMRSEHWRMVLGVHMTSTQTSSTNGVAIGPKGVNYAAHNSMAMFYNMSSTNNGHSQLFYQNQSNSSTWTQGWTATQSTAVANASSDRIILTFDRIFNQFHYTIYNQTQNLTTYDTTFAITPIGIPLPNTYVPTIWRLGGNLAIDSLNIVELDPYNPDNMIVGDSKGIFGQSTFQQTYPAILGYFYPNTVIQHGFGDLTGNILSGWPDVKRVMPKMVLYEGGSNDIRFSQTANTAANIKAFHDSCIAYGITFWCISPVRESVQDNSSQLSIFATYLPNEIYAWDIGVITGNLYTDGIHLSNAGAQQLARRVREANALYNPKNDNQFNSVSGLPTFY